jgi:signal transduction histidine kinase
MGDPLGAAIAFAALGANVLATALFLLFNPRSAAVRWFAAFLTAISLWLLSAGMMAITGTRGAWVFPFAAAVTLLPVMFLASMLVQAEARPRWLPWAVTAVGLLFLPLTAAPLLGRMEGGTWLVVAWQAAGWGGGVLVDRTLGSSRRSLKEPAWARRLVDGLLLIPPLAVVGGIALGAQAFFAYVMPLLIVGTHVVLFAGVVLLRFYDIEVRAARSGEIAGAMAEAGRLAAVGELAASVAHEVRNPLTGVRSLAQRMAEEDLDADRVRRYAAVIVDEVGRVDRIVRDLLAVARRESAVGWSGEPTPLDPLFEDLALLTASRAERAGVRLRFDGGGVVATTPREPLAQALLNLVLNAIRHTPRGGVVEVAAQAGNGVEIAVRDQGPGVPVSERERIFEPFHSGGLGGTGLGLAVVRRLARELGWEVAVEDAPDRGAVFRLRIPGKDAARLDHAGHPLRESARSGT